MFYSEAQKREFDDDMAQDAMSQGEYMSAALDQYAGARGVVDVTREWVLSPYDTWHRNPYYTGPRGRHPEDDYHDEQAEDAAFIPTTPGTLLDAYWDDEVPF